MQTKTTHTHKFTRSKPKATVETCTCGKFQHTEHAGPAIVEVKPKSTHTPGPWSLDESCKYYNNPVIRMNGIVITSLSNADMKIDEHRANANLIAAAPELLGACRLALCAITPEDSTLATQLKQAIAKAEGR